MSGLRGRQFVWTLVLSILSLLCPFPMPWLPDVEFSPTPSGAGEVRVTLDSGSPVPTPNALWIEVHLEDDSGRIRSDSEMRGLPLIVQASQPDADPLLVRSIQGLGPGGCSVTFGTLEDAYPGSSIDRVLPAQGAYTLLVRVLPEPKIRQR